MELRPGALLIRHKTGLMPDNKGEANIKLRFLFSSVSKTGIVAALGLSRVAANKAFDDV